MVSYDTPLHDSVVAGERNSPEMAIVYDNHRAYPAYLLTFQPDTTRSGGPPVGAVPATSPWGNPFRA